MLNVVFASDKIREILNSTPLTSYYVYGLCVQITNEYTFCNAQSNMYSLNPTYFAVTIKIRIH